LQAGGVGSRIALVIFHVAGEAGRAEVVDARPDRPLVDLGPSPDTPLVHAVEPIGALAVDTGAYGTVVPAAAESSSCWSIESGGVIGVAFLLDAVGVRGAPLLGAAWSDGLGLVDG